MNILITGSQGNLGTFLQHELAMHKLTLVDKETWPKFVASKVTCPEIIIHCASDLKSSIANSPSAIVDANIASTATLLEMAKESKTKLFCFISSCAVYGDKGDTSEDTQCSPITINGITKLLNEKIVKAFCEANKINFLIIRPFNIFGGKDHFSILYHLDKSKNNNTAFNLNNRGISQRDFIHVADLAKLIHNLLQNNIIDETINIGTGNTVRISEIVNCYQETFGTLAINETFNKEVEYSRANIKKLEPYVDFQMICIKNFIKNKFKI